MSGRSTGRQRSILLAISVQKLGRLRSGSRGRRQAWAEIDATADASTELQRRVDEHARTVPNSAVDQGRTYWGFAVNPDTVEELRRRITETANELDRLGEHHPWWSRERRR